MTQAMDEFIGRIIRVMIADYVGGRECISSPGVTRATIFYHDDCQGVSSRRGHTYLRISKAKRFLSAKFRLRLKPREP